MCETMGVYFTLFIGMAVGFLLGLLVMAWAVKEEKGQTRALASEVKE